MEKLLTTEKTKTTTKKTTPSNKCLRAMCCLVASVVSDSVRPHRWQPTRLPRPWDSPGKNTRVGCHFLLQRIKVKSESEVAQSCPTLSDPMDCSLPGSFVHDFPGQSTGVECHSSCTQELCEETIKLGIPWWSSSQDSILSLSRGPGFNPQRGN